MDVISRRVLLTERELCGSICELKD
jgi:hypothetical protein